MMEASDHNDLPTTQEAVPLLDVGQQQRQPASYRSLLLLLCLFVLERCSYYEYISIMVYTNGNRSYEYCGALEGPELQDTWWSTVYLQLPQCVSFLMPLLGGYLADQFCGCATAVKLGCAIYHVGAWLLLALVYWNAACSTELIVACEVLLLSAAALLRPSLIVLTIESGQQLMGLRQMCQLHYLWEAAGQALGYLLVFLSDVYQVPLACACVPSTLLMLLMSIVGVKERPGWQPRLFSLPAGWPRLRRITMVGTPLIVVSFGIILGYYTLSVTELAGAIEPSQGTLVRWYRDLLLLCYSASLVASVVVVMLTTRAFTILQPVEARITVGIAVVGLCHFVAFPITYIKFDPSSLQMLSIVYCCLNAIYALGEAFSITTADEVAFRIAPAESRTFIMGLFIGFWGSGYCFSTIVELLRGHASVLHLALVGLLFGNFLYFTSCSVRPLRWLLDIQSADVE